jgi:hypothetical protein
MLIAVAAAMILFLGWAGEAMGDWAGSDPGRIKTVLIVETAVLIGLLVYVIRIWRRRRGTLLGE